jgi:DNA polymerase (family 10)
MKCQVILDVASHSSMLISHIQSVMETTQKATHALFSQALIEASIWMELMERNPYLTTAYYNAGNSIKNLQEDLAVLLAEDRLQHVPGLSWWGTEKITKLLQHGLTEPLDGLLDSLNESEINEARAFYQRLGVKDLHTLRSRYQQGLLPKLEERDIRRIQQIIDAVERRESYARQRMWVGVESLVQEIQSALSKLEGVEQSEVTGDFRRYLETVTSIEFVVATKSPEIVIRGLKTLPRVTQIGEEKSNGVQAQLDNGLPAIFHITEPDSFGYLLHHLTGSSTYLDELSQYAESRGYQLKEDGLYRTGESQPVAVARDEKVLFETLELDFIPVELREGQGEIAAAAAHTLPVPLQFSDLQGIFHNHTTISDGRDSVAEMAAAAAQFGWKYFGLADHSFASEEKFNLQIEEVRQLNASGEIPITILTGIETNILPDGGLDYGEGSDLLTRLDYVVAGVHGAWYQDIETATRRLIRAIEHPEVNIISHLTARMLLSYPGLPMHVEKILDAAVANQVAIELNTTDRRLDLNWRYWKHAVERGVVCAIDPDAHLTSQVAQTRLGIPIARKGWVEKENVLNCRSLEEIRKFFKK